MKDKKAIPQSKAYWALALTAIVFLSAGVIIGWYPAHKSRSAARDIIPFAIREISADEIGSNLRFLTSIPHVAGTEQDALLAEWIKDHFIDAGLDEVKTVPYNVLLSYPKPGVPNIVSLIDEQGKSHFESLGRQPALGSPEETSEHVMLNFNAYSANGVAEGNLVYAHYGRKKDFEYLISRGINITGNILLIRLGAMFRGSKVALAEKYGAKGVILFSDRMEKTTQDRSNTYPHSWWMPGKGTEYGLVSRPKDGDVLTPFYPALEDAFRISEEGHPSLPKIPVQSIGYEEAEMLLNFLSPENPAPSSWVGKLNAPYRLGPNFIEPGWKVVLNVSTTNERRIIYNTIGILRGSVEEDRYVILGNHRDAWAFGALDPSSGTASMIEIARVLGNFKTTQKWRPRRTIVFCSWSASEYGFIGSHEWIQQYAKVLNQRAVAYLNVDAAVTGNRTLYANAFPTLKQLIIDSSKLIPNPNVEEVSQGLGSVYDTWLAHAPDKENSSRPMVGNLGGGSDFVGFAYVVGVPSSDFGYTSHGSYPTYHSLYDSFLLASEIVDKGFVHHQAVARMWTAVALKLADSTVLPFDVSSYAQVIERSLSDIEEKFKATLESNNATLRYVRYSVERFVLAVQDFDTYATKNLDEGNELAVRCFNDKLMLLERYFMDPHGLPERPEANHIIFSPSVSESHVSDTFTGLVDLLLRVGNNSLTQDPFTWNKIKQHLASISFLVGEAARSLNEHF